MSRIARIVAVSWLAAVFALSGGLWQVCAALTAVPLAAAADGQGLADPMMGPTSGHQMSGHQMSDHQTMADDGDAHSHHQSHPGSTDTPLCAQFCAMAGVVILNDTAARVGVRFTATPVVFEAPDSRHIDGISWLDPDIPKPVL